MYISYSVIPKCSSVDPCKHNGVCEKSRCFCTDHYGPSCETGKLPHYKVCIQVFHDEHKVVNVDNVGIKGFYRSKKS